MKKHVMFWGFLCLMLVTFGCAGPSAEVADDETSDALPAYSGKKITIAIMDFETKVPGYDWRIGRGASDMLTTSLVKSKKFRVYERNKLSSIMKEQGLHQSGAIDPSTAVKLGKLIGVKYILTGAVTEYGNSQTGFSAGHYASFGKKGYASAVDVRAIDVQTGEIVFAETADGELKSTHVRVLGIGGGEKFDSKKATESMRMAIDKVMKVIYIDLN